MTSMSDLQVKAIRAVAETDPNGPNGKLPTIRLLRGMTDKRHTLRDYIDAVEWAMARPRHALTRADKERAVAEMADRLTIACFHVATSYDHKLPDDPDERADFLADRRSFEWSMYRKQKALVRLSMARTVD